MRLPGDDEQRPAGFSLIYTIIGVSAFVLIMLVAVMGSNKKQAGGGNSAQKLQQQKQEAQAALEDNADGQNDELKPKLRAEDLDFWDMYPVDEEDAAPDTSSGSKSESRETVDKAEEDNKKEEKIQEILKEDPSADGKHTLIKSADGTEEWVLISPYLKKNTYDFTNLSESAGIRKYTESGKKVSKVGVNISKHSGAVNFGSMKSAGIDYVMLRLGARGYSTGQISVDDNFVENIEAAIEAGLDIGIYFYSQAISQEEATQEANFVIQNLEPYKAHINYPVAFDMENVPNDNARIDGLARDDKTTITATFLSGIQAAGYIPMLYGNKEWLIKNIDLAKVQDYDVWLAEDEAIPDYPYLYTMWQYTTTGVINGVSGDASVNICFVSYSDR